MQALRRLGTLLHRRPSRLRRLASALGIGALGVAGMVDAVALAGGSSAGIVLAVGMAPGLVVAGGGGPAVAVGMTWAARSLSTRALSRRRPSGTGTSAGAPAAGDRATSVAAPRAALGAHILIDHHSAVPRVHLGNGIGASARGSRPLGSRPVGAARPAGAGPQRSRPGGRSGGRCLD